MNKWLFIVVIGWGVLATSYLSVAQSCDGCIAWSRVEKLGWADFKAKPDQYTITLNHFLVAVTYDYERNNSGTYVFDVHCNFMGNESWCIKERVRPYMLEHVQGNFDIDEVYARKLKQDLVRYASAETPSRNKIKWIYNKNEEERTAFNTQYDLETNHGYYFKEQEIWNQKIAAMLGELKPFASK